MNSHITWVEKQSKIYSYAVHLTA